MKTTILCVFLAILLLSFPTQAKEDSWQFRLAPYLWFAGLEGDIATLPPLPAVPVDISSSDALADTEAALMLMFEAKKQRHGVFFDLVYTDLQSEEELIPAPISLQMKATSKNTLVTLAYQYELYRKDQAILDVLAGARYWSIDTTLEFGGGLGILAGTVLNHEESWVDPAVGIKGRIPISTGSNFYLEGFAGVGGFGVGSDLFYDLNLNIGYQWNKAVGTGFGYRLYDVDYDKDDFLYDVKQQGWLIGLTWAF